MRAVRFLACIGVLILTTALVAGCSERSDRKKASGTPAEIVAEVNAAQEAQKAQKAGASGALPGLQTGEAPWRAEKLHLRDRLEAIGLPGLKAEGTAVHSHQHLDIFVHGHPVPVPEYIGIQPEERFISHIHTHDGTGEIHIESPSVQVFNLGQFFDIWGVHLTATCLGAYCEDGKNVLRAFVDGEPAADPRAIRLQDREEIVLVYGTPEEAPDPVPARYDWPTGS